MNDIENFLKVHPFEFYKKFFSKGYRPDGREFYQSRKTLIKKSNFLYSS
jgi:exosome complex RNA-binding protein Rrp42 (RNase PH superfamily)